VTINGFWTDAQVHRTLWYSAWLHFTVHYYTHTHTHQYPVTSSLPLLGSGFQRRTFPSLWVPELSPASVTSFSQNSSRLSPGSSRWSCFITPRHGPRRKRLFHYSYTFVAVETWLYTEPLLSNGCCIVVSRTLYSNGSTHHIVPSLRILVPNSLQTYRHFFLFRGLYFWRLFFRFGGGRPLHNVQSLSLSATHWKSRPLASRPPTQVCSKASYNAFWLPRRSSCLLLSPLMPLSVVLPGALQIRPLLSAGVAWRVNRPQAEANFCRDPPSPSVLFFGGPRRLTARRRSPDRPSRVPTVSITDLISSGYASIFSRQASKMAFISSWLVQFFSSKNLKACSYWPLLGIQPCRHFAQHVRHHLFRLNSVDV
jgi:hypothetical protein